MNDRKCYAFNINIGNQTSCHFYNKSTPSTRLSESSQTEYYSEFRDCQDWYDFGVRNSGVYQVNWMSRMIKDVRCNMQIDGGGWMTFQQRFDGNIKFHDKTWEEYKNGFGTPKGEFWLGNDFLNEITSSGDYFFLAKAETFDGDTEVSKYGQFRIEDEENLYRLHFNETLLDGIHTLYDVNKRSNSNGMAFSTLDKDTELLCVFVNKRGAFWHNNDNNCSKFRPNGIYYTEQACLGNSKGFKWLNWKRQCLKSVQMLIKQM